jgi:peptidoglycan/LPS O-acetylase OafA/YrhL
MPAHYRRDIDGLRAIAITAVVLDHAGLGPVPGGYAGVDIFFVVSGYLITTLLCEEMAAGPFSIVRFYDRRIRRLLPALFAMLALVSAAAFPILNSLELSHLVRSSIAAVAFASNVFFLGSTGYFAPAADQMPLLHTWSLAVEEQFYILYPLALALLLRPRWRRLLPAALAGGIVLSLGLAEWATGRFPDAAYYMLPTRAWELLLGALLAIPLPPRPGRIPAQLLAAAGLCLIAGSVMLYGAGAPFPGLAAAPPCLGAALIIHAGRRGGSTIVGRFLGSGVPVFLGRISYSLYLWHWPLLVLAGIYLDRDLTDAEAAAAVLIAVALAALSWRYVESPFRGRGFRPERARARVRAGMASALALSAVLLGLLALRHAVPPVPALARAADAALTDVNAGRDGCLVVGDALPPAEGCLFGPGAATGAYEVVLWGDSHADHYAAGIAEAAGRAGLTMREIWKDGCPPLPGVRFTRPGSGELPRCPPSIGAVFDFLLKAPNVRLLVLAARWSRWELERHPDVLVSDAVQPGAGPDSYRRAIPAALARLVEAMTARGVRVLLLGEVPAFPQVPGRCVFRAAIRGDDPSGCSIVDAGVSAEVLAFGDGTIADLVRAYAGTHAFFPSAALCDDRVCRAEAEGVLLYRDDQHLNPQGARYLGRHIDLGAILAD